MAADRILESLSNRMLDLDGQIKKNRVTFEDTIEFITSKKNAATVSKTKSDVKRFKEWLLSAEEDRPVEEIPAGELDVLLSRFILTLRNIKTNKELEPTTIQGMIASIRRYLIEKNYPEDITTSDLFRHTRNTLKAKAKDLKEKGLGNKVNRADRFTDEEIQELYDKHLLGDSNPKALISTIWINYTMHLGLRGRQEHLSMLWGDLEMAKTNGQSSKKYLEFTERATKTRKGLNDDPRAFKPKIWEQPGDPNCPVKLYLFYKEHRPTVEPQSRFYLQPNRYWETKGNWYTITPMGKDSLGKIASNLSEKAGFAGKHTNHSGRKSFISKLLDQGVSPTEVAQLSGHKNLHSLNHYHTLSLARQEQLSSIIHASSKVTYRQNEFSDDISDQEIVHASQEIERTLHSIDSFEEVPLKEPVQSVQRIDIPVVHSPGGTMGISNLMSMPQTLFTGCTFHHPVNITFNH